MIRWLHKLNMKRLAFKKRGIGLNHRDSFIVNTAKHTCSTRRDFGVFSNWFKRIRGRSDGDGNYQQEFENLEHTRYPSVFERILNLEFPAELVYEDDVCIAVLDIAPSPPTQFLIAPKQYIEGIKGVSTSLESKRLLGHLLLVAKDVADQLEMFGGYRIIINEGEHGCQLYDHLHLYVIGSRQLGWPPG
jgi:histidine triad (HIT) family protein